MDYLTLNNQYGETTHIAIKNSALDRVYFYLKKFYKNKNVNLTRPVIITDNIVSKLYAGRINKSLQKEGFSPIALTLTHGELTKSYSTLEQIHHKFVKKGVTRNTPIIAVGGGVVTDIAALAASTFMRGLPLILIPTSFVGQIDAAIGGKTAINLPEGKNLVGTFYQPDGIIVDPLTLVSLSNKEFISGIGEMIKSAFLSPDNIYTTVRFKFNKILSKDKATLRKVVFECIKIKCNIVSQDEKEEDDGIRMLLNLGHTLGHAVEALYGYKKISHGYAVILGMAFALFVSNEEEVLEEPGMLDEFMFLMNAYKIKFKQNLICDIDQTMDFIKRDKKIKFTKIPMILPIDLGLFCPYYLSGRTIKKHLKNFVKSTFYKNLSR